MLAVLQWGGLLAGLATLVAAVLLTLMFPFFRLLPHQLLIALGEGITTSLLVFYVLLPGLLLYHLQRTIGSMDVLGQAIARLIPDQDLQALLLVMGLAPFAESVSGFGVGIILVVPIFVALGFSLRQAAMLSILGQMLVPWGGLAVGTTLGAELTDLDPSVLGAHTALLMAPLPVIYGLVALAVSGGKKAVRRRWSAALVAGGVLSGGVWIFSLAPGIELAGVLATVLAMALLVAWGHMETRKFHAAKGTAQIVLVAFDGSRKVSHEKVVDKELGIAEPYLWQVLAPYVILVALLLISRLVVPIKIWLQNHCVLSVPTVKLYLPLLYNPGFWLLLTSLATVQILGTGVLGLRVAAVRAWRQFVPGAVAIVCFLVASQVMQASRMTTTLGMATAVLGDNYKWVAPWLGAIGGWITGSNTGSNALFALLQQEASVRSGLPLDWLMAAQNGASSQVTMVSPTRTILAVTAVGLPNGEAYLLRRIGPVVLAAVTVIMLLLAWAI
jgi:lactate permease